MNSSRVRSAILITACALVGAGWAATAPAHAAPGFTYVCDKAWKAEDGGVYEGYVGGIKCKSSDSNAPTSGEVKEVKIKDKESGSTWNCAAAGIDEEGNITAVNCR
ncbi:hypothetical protein ACWIGW_35045 [Nocardia brasiliensis]